MQHLHCNVRNEEVGFCQLWKKAENNTKSVNKYDFFSSTLEKLDFQFLQICPSLEMQTWFSHVSTSNEHTWSIHNILGKNLIFLTDFIVQILTEINVHFCTWTWAENI